MLKLHVHDWQHQLALPRHWPASVGVPLRGDLEAHTPGMAQAMAKGLQGQLDEHEVVYLPLLQLRGSLDPRADWSQTEQAWARQLSAALAAALRQGQGWRWPSAAHHTASYLLARSRGGIRTSDPRAGAWRPFDGLAALPRGAALRTLLAASVEQGLQILRTFQESERAEVARALGTQEALRLGADWCCSARPGGELLALPQSGAGTLAMTAWSSLLPVGPAAELDTPRAATMASAFLNAAWLQASVTERNALWRMLATRRRVSTDGQVGWLHEDLVTPLLAALAPGQRRMLRQQWQARTPTQVASAVAGPAEGHEASGGHTPHGGIAWLMYAMREWLANAASWPWQPPPDGAAVRPAGTLALMLVCAAMPPASALGLWHDRVWRQVLGVPPAWGMTELNEWLMHNLRAVQHGQAGWSDWLSRWSLEACQLRHGSACWVDRGSGLWLNVDAAATLPEAAPIDWPTRRVLTRRLSAEVAFLQANEFTPLLPPAWQALLVPAAQAALRRLAHAVPGLAWSSPLHLHTNVLDVPGRLQGLQDLPGAASSAWQLALPRPPLDVLLTLTGLNRLRFEAAPGVVLQLAREEPTP